MSAVVDRLASWAVPMRGYRQDLDDGLTVDENWMYRRAKSSSAAAMRGGTTFPIYRYFTLKTATHAIYETLTGLHEGYA